MEANPTLKIVISGAAGRIAYQLYSNLCSGYIFGLTVPLKAVRTLGSDAAFYVRFIQEGLLVTFAVLIAILPAILNNMGSGWPKNNESWAEQ